MKKILLLLIVFSLQFFVFNATAQSVPAGRLNSGVNHNALDPLIAVLKNTHSKDSIRTVCLDFARQNQNDAGVYVVTRFLPQLMSRDSIIMFIDSLEYYRTNQSIASMKAFWEKEAQTAEGKMFVDFAVEYNGKVTKLSDYVGKGKYVLVDFWASWCGPCKEEVPNLIAIYNKYKGEKFTVLGVAISDAPEATLQAMNSLGINYPQILNAQQIGGDAYGIKNIPQIILFGPDGTILKRDLRGAAIEQTVSEYLK